MEPNTDPTARTATTWATYRRRLPPAPERRAIREAAGCSRAQVAEELDVSIAIVGRWERGEREPSRRFIRAYVELLNRLATLTGPDDDAA